MKEKIYRRIANMLPSKIVYFCFFRFWANATCTDEGRTMTPDEIKWTLAVKLWERRYGKV